MSYFRYCILAIVCVAFTHTTIAVGYPHLPENWEERTDTRFDPRIELVAHSLSFFPSKDDSQTAEYAWHKWGAEALPVVLKLRDNPEWNEFRHAFTVLLCICPLEEASGIQDQLFFTALRAAPGSSSALLQPTPEAGDLLDTLTRYNANAGLEIVRKLAANESPWLQLMAAERLGFGNDEDRSLAKSIIEGLAQSEITSVRERVAYLLLSRIDEDSCARALELAKTLSPESQKTFNSRYEAVQGELRANQPMSRILKLEAAHESPNTQN